MNKDFYSNLPGFVCLIFWFHSLEATTLVCLTRGGGALPPGTAI